MKTFALACTLSAVLMSGAAYAEGSPSLIDPSLITLTAGDGLDSNAYAQGNDHTGGMWEGAVGESGSMAAQRPAYVASVPNNRQWSRLPTHRRRTFGDAD